MDILLTGATGFLGQHLITQLIKAHKIYALVRLDSNTSCLPVKSPMLELIYIEKHYINNKLRLPLHFDTIIHCATDYGRTSVFSAFDANVALPIHIMEAITLQNTSRPYFINIDSFFSDHSGTYRHLEAYALSKKNTKDWGYLLDSNNLLTFINLKLFHLYGCNDNTSKFTTNIIQQLLLNREIPMTKGLQCRDFIYVSDVVNAIEVILTKLDHLTENNFEIGSGIATSIKTFTNLAHKLSKSKSNLLYGEIPEREGEIQAAIANTKSICSLGWQPNISLEQGITKIIEQLKLTF